MTQILSKKRGEEKSVDLYYTVNLHQSATYSVSKGDESSDEHGYPGG
jgi:hypothetical protein